MAKRIRKHEEILFRDESGRKKCVRCALWKLVDDFSDYARGVDGKHYYCKQCNTDVVRERTYGTTMTVLEGMLKEQGGCCAICGTNDFGSRGWMVDHDHATGNIRWILCTACNFGLGFFRDDPILLRKAATMLDNRRF